MINPQETQGASRRGNKTLTLFKMLSWKQDGGSQRGSEREDRSLISCLPKKRKGERIQSKGKQCVNQFSKLRAVVIRLNMLHTNTHTNLAEPNACSHRLFWCCLAVFTHSARGHVSATCSTTPALFFFFTLFERFDSAFGTHLVFKWLKTFLESPRERLAIKAEVVSPPY